MPTTNNRVMCRHLANVYSSSGISYADALTIAGFAPNIGSATRFGFHSGSFLGTPWWRANHVLSRMDLRRFRGAKCTAVTFEMYTLSIDKTAGGNTSTMEMRSFTRDDRGGDYTVNDHMTPAEMGAATLYATHAGRPTNASSEVLTFTNSGTVLLDAVNAALDGDGILDFALTLANYRTSTPPSGTNTEYVYVLESELMYATPYQNEAAFILTIEGEQDHFYPAATAVDIARIWQSEAVWNDCLIGTNPYYDNSPDTSESLSCGFSTSYTCNQLLVRYNLSGIDTTKGIKKAFFTFMHGRGDPAATSVLPWHIRRYDWIGTPTDASYRTQSQLSLLTKVCEFLTSDIGQNGGFPTEDSDDANIITGEIDGGQGLIDICLTAPSNVGFVIHHERNVTGVAPTTGDDSWTIAPIGDDRAAEAGWGIHVLYDDGSDFFGGLF